MKRFLMAMLLGLIVQSAAWATAREWKTLRIGVEAAYPPFSYVQPDGKLAGFNIDIARALGNAMGMEVTLVPQEWKTMIPALLAGKFDAIVASMTITKKRKEQVAFTKKYYKSPAKFICRKGRLDSFKPETFSGRLVGVQRATIHDRYLTDTYGKAVRIKRYDTLEAAYLDLFRGDIELLFGDSVVLSYGFLKKPEGREFGFVGPDLSDSSWFGSGKGIAIRKTDQDLLELFNTAIDTIQSNGEWGKIQSRYFDFNMYGD